MVVLMGLSHIAHAPPFLWNVGQTGENFGKGGFVTSR